MGYVADMALNERDLKFFRPLWLRVAITAALAVWCALEIIFTHEQLWIAITGFGVAYCLYNFFWKWPKVLPTLAAPAGAAPAGEAVPPTPEAGTPAAPEPPAQP
jgi:hypothetical protein